MEIEFTIEAKESGMVAVKRLPFQNRLVLGRGPDSPVALDGAGISREHISFEPSNDGVKVADLSANGTWINGLRLQPGTRYIATEADKVSIPGYEFRFLLMGAAPAAKAAQPASQGQQPPKATPAATPATPPPAPSKPLLQQITRLEWFAAAIVAAAILIGIVYATQM